jgi:DNA-directed RNA polymerase subunit RPC12/RpoP
MAVQIIDPKPHHSVVKEVLCRDCGVKLSYTPNDIKRKSHTDYTGGTDEYKTIKCPSCSNTIYLN